MSIITTSTSRNSDAVITTIDGLAQGDETKEVKSAPEDAEKSQSLDETLEDSEASESNDEEDQSDSQDDEGLKDETKDDDQKPKKKGGFKKKIGRLQSELSTTRQEIERLRQEVSAKSEGQKEKATTSDDKPKADNFDTHEDYIDALTDWKINQREANAKQKTEIESAKTQYDNSLKSHQERIEAFKKSEQGAGFQKAVDSFMEEYGEPEFSLVMTNLIVGSDLGPAVVYELAKNKEAFDKINSLPPLQAAVEFGKLEAKVSKSSSSEKPKLTKAPAPMTPVGNGKTTFAKALNDPNISFAEYEKQRMQQLKNK